MSDKPSNRSASLRNLRILFGVIAVLCVIALIVIRIRVPELQKDTFVFELVKSLMQIITVLILGQFVAVTIDNFKFKREKAEIRSEFQKDILRRLIKSYTGIKKHRRLLRAKALEPPYSGGEFDPDTRVKFEAFDEQMQSINDIELEIENIRYEIKSSPGLFTNSEELGNGIEKNMEKYLRDLITIYERKLGDFAGKPNLPLDDMISGKEACPNLKDFLGSTGISGRLEYFAKMSRKVMAQMRNDILGEEEAQSANNSKTE